MEHALLYRTALRHTELLCPLLRPIVVPEYPNFSPAGPRTTRFTPRSAPFVSEFCGLSVSALTPRHASTVRVRLAVAVRIFRGPQRGHTLNAAGRLRPVLD